ncbi:uncharacterized protein N7506_007474 [Penicillium brevicompactum]|uniref:uncharacterized protein n=1 Tax=Penicillium brevicompactum TaxID=5074 RepID=UPI00254260E9|nr:uncharacterized protein N7506_007474 [Penicillium brevicompactum]KAJ5333691.1 hypothetical protein N7506_007474 [Penicillium brevicompactum]
MQSSAQRTQYPYGESDQQTSPRPSVSGSTDTSMSSQQSGRSSSASSRTQSSKNPVSAKFESICTPVANCAISPTQPDKQISQIEKSVTHLLVATKQLLETLTQWSRKQATENDVSDVYVRLGYEFNLACRAFSAIGVDTSDLGPVPDLLRTILEDTLSQDASAASLDRYLPRIRDIIINLLHGLKKKQARLRSRHQREDGRPAPGRNASAGSIASGQAIGQLYDEAAASTMPSTAQSPRRSSNRRFGSNGSLEDQPPTARTSSAPSSNDPRSSNHSERESSRREAQQLLSQTPTDNDTTPRANTSNNTAPSTYTTPAGFPAPPPPPPPKEDDALGALQRSGELERRASRRFSAYQIQKHLGTSTNGVPVLPTQNSPIPNRGRDVRESLNAVRLRGSYNHSRQKSTNRVQDAGKTTQAQPPTNIPNVVEEERTPPVKAASPAPTPAVSLEAEAPVDKVDPEEAAIVPPPINTPSQEKLGLEDAFEPAKAAPRTPKTSSFGPTAQIATPPRKIKKYVLPDGIADLTIGRLQLAFIEKFAWNTHDNGVDLPEIYIQDPISGIRHELEDLSDVKDRCVLVLNVDNLDEVKKHFDDGLGGVRQLVEGLKDVITGQGSAIQRVSDRQVEAAKEIARLAAAPPATSAASGSGSKALIAGDGAQLAEIQSLRRDLAVLRQTYSNFTADIKGSMSAVRTKASKVKTAADDVATPSYEGDAGRARVNTGKKELAGESERLVARVDDLQDLVEDLRKDVVTRGVRPLPRQLEGVSRDISTVMKEIKKMQDFLGREKPIWTKIWEKELQLVCEERDQLTMQEDLAADLQDDLEKATQTFALVEQATKEQVMSNSTGSAGPAAVRATSRSLGIDPTLDPMKAKDGVLGEVRALQPNHESRVEAIERAEKARKKELETRRNNLFQKELGAFVEEGKLKKSGGFEETERLRTAKDERIRKEVWDRQQARNAEMERAEAEAAAAAAAEAQENADGEDGDNHGDGDSNKEADETEHTPEKPDEPEETEGHAEEPKSPSSPTDKPLPAAPEEADEPTEKPLSPALI